MNKILTVVHQTDSTWGKVGEQLIAMGFELHRCCPHAGDELPQSLDGYAGSVIFGGPQSATDDHLPEIRAELDWIEQVGLPSGLPTLGICLGAQQLARVLGAKVGPHDDGLVEIGYYEIRPTAAAGEFLTGPTWFYQWHSETFGIPDGATHLAETDAFPGQAFVYRENVYAIEFHPEMTFDMVQRWSTSTTGSAKLAKPGAQPASLHLEGYERHAAGSDEWLANFLQKQFLAGALPAQAAAE